MWLIILSFMLGGFRLMKPHNTWIVMVAHIYIGFLLGTSKSGYYRFYFDAKNLIHIPFMSPEKMRFFITLNFLLLLLFVILEVGCQTYLR